MHLRKQTDRSHDEAHHLLGEDGEEQDDEGDGAVERERNGGEDEHRLGSDASRDMLRRQNEQHDGDGGDDEGADDIADEGDGGSHAARHVLFVQIHDLERLPAHAEGGDAVVILAQKHRLDGDAPTEFPRRDLQKIGVFCAFDREIEKQHRKKQRETAVVEELQKLDEAHAFVFAARHIVADGEHQHDGEGDEGEHQHGLDDPRAKLRARLRPHAFGRQRRLCHIAVGDLAIGHNSS